MAKGKETKEKEYKLTEKQEKFCQEVVNTGNQTEAYRRAYNAENMKERTIISKAYAMMQKEYIRSTIAAIKKPVLEKVVHTLSESIQQDLDLIKRYERALNMLESLKSTENEIKAAQRTIRYIGASGYNGAKDRLNKINGHYEKDNEQKKESVVTTFQLPDNNRGK